MSIIALVAQLIKSASAANSVNYEAYNIKDTDVFYGIPPIEIKGIDSIRAVYTAPRTKVVVGLTAKGVHLDNRNTAGIVEIGMMAGSFSGGAIQAMGALKLPFPIIIEDSKSGGSSTVVATECRLANVPPFRRDAAPGVDVYTFSAARIAIVPGMRLVTD